MKYLPLTIFLAVFIAPFIIIAEGMPNFPFLSVVGHAEVEVEPDVSDIEFQIITFDKHSDSALRQLGSVSNEVSRYLTSIAISEKHINSFNVAKNVKRSRHSGSGQQTDIIGYEMRQRYQVKLFDLTKFDQLVNKLLQTDGIESLNINFDLKDRASLEAKLALRAGQDAKQRATNLATGVSAKIASVYSVKEQNNYNRHAKFSEIRSAATNMITAPPETITLSKSIEVIYRITP